MPLIVWVKQKSPEFPRITFFILFYFEYTKMELHKDRAEIQIGLHGVAQLVVKCLVI